MAKKTKKYVVEITEIYKGFVEIETDIDPIKEEDDFFEEVDLETADGNAIWNASNIHINRVLLESGKVVVDNTKEDIII